MKNNLLLLFMLFLMYCQNNASKSGTLFSSNSCDVYLGEWTGSTTMYGQVEANPITFVITSNGENYLLGGKNPSTGEKFDAIGALICENGLLMENGRASITYVKNGDYCLIFGDKFYKNSSKKQREWEDIYVGEWEDEYKISHVKIIKKGLDYFIESEEMEGDSPDKCKGTFQLINGVLVGKTSCQDDPNKFYNETLELSSDKKTLFQSFENVQFKNSLHKIN